MCDVKTVKYCKMVEWHDSPNYTMHVDGVEVIIVGYSACMYFKKHYQELGYVVEIECE
jgi:hypothetical protein